MTGWRKIVANLLQAPLNMILFTISIYICNNKYRHMINIQHCQYRCNGVESIRLPSSSISPLLTSDRLRLAAPRVSEMRNEDEVTFIWWEGWIIGGICLKMTCAYRIWKKYLYFMQIIFILISKTYSTSHITITATGWAALDSVSSCNVDYKRDYCLGSERGLIR